MQENIYYIIRLLLLMWKQDFTLGGSDGANFELFYIGLQLMIIFILD